MNTLPRNFRKIALIAIIIPASFFVFSCNRKTKKGKVLTSTQEAFNDRLKSLLQPVDTVKKTGIGNTSYNLKYNYQLDEYLPIWVTTDYIPSTAAQTYLTELEGVWQDGLTPEKYHLTDLKKLMGKLTGKDIKVDDAIAFDTLLTTSYLQVAKDLLLGTIVPKKVDSLWFHANDSTWQVPEKLAGMEGQYFSLNEYRSTLRTYTLLRDEYKHYHDLMADSELHAAIASIEVTTTPDGKMEDVAETIIKKEIPWASAAVNDSVNGNAQLLSTYQYYTGIKVTGKLDSTTLKHLSVQPDSVVKILGANMERVRWMQQSFGNLYILVNIPLMELFLRRDGGDSMHMRVVVGKTVRQTPSLYALMTNIVINPKWEVPPTILKQDVLPGLQKTGKAYLAKKGLKVYDRDGNAVNAGLVTEKNYRRYNYQQAPGDDNALGYVKFNLPNPFDIYLHDTPHRGDFVKGFRALSSGCIRIQHPKEMAIYILSELEKKRYNEDRLDSIIATHKTQWQVLKNKIPVHITYLTAFEDSTNTHLRLLNDVYQRNDKLIAKLYN